MLFGDVQLLNLMTPLGIWGFPKYPKSPWVSILYWVMVIHDLDDLGYSYDQLVRHIVHKPYELYRFVSWKPMVTNYLVHQIRKKKQHETNIGYIIYIPLYTHDIYIYIYVCICIYIYGYGSIPINTIFRGMNIHLPAILMWTTGVQGFDTLPYIYIYSLYRHPAAIGGHLFGAAAMKPKAQAGRSIFWRPGFFGGCRRKAQLNGEKHVADI